MQIHMWLFAAGTLLVPLCMVGSSSAVQRTLIDSVATVANCSFFVCFIMCTKLAYCIWRLVQAAAFACVAGLRIMARP